MNAEEKVTVWVVLDYDAGEQLLGLYSTKEKAQEEKDKEQKKKGPLNRVTYERWYLQ